MKRNSLETGGLVVGYHYHEPAFQRGAHIVMPATQGRFLDALAGRCRRLVCFLHTPLPAEQHRLDYRIGATNVELVDIGLHESVPRRLVSAPWRLRAFTARRAELDALLLFGPSPLLPQFAARAGETPTALFLVADYLAGLRGGSLSRLRRFGVRTWARWNTHQQRRAAGRALTFVNSEVLHREYAALAPQTRLLPASILREEDFYERDDTCTRPPFRLLYTGRIIPEKGLLDLVDAVSRLRAIGRDVVLHLVGGADENGEEFPAEIEAFARERGLSDRVHLHGHVPIGAALFRFYREADIFVTASRYSEGFPRTIWEAMAHGLPVVATAVGGVPFTLRDGDQALLVRPRSAAALAEAIERLLSDATLRRRLVAQGQALARTATLARMVDQMMAALVEHTGHHRSSHTPLCV